MPDALLKSTFQWGLGCELDRYAHLSQKNEHRLERNRLKGTAGNQINAILAAAAMNFQKHCRAFWRVFPFCLMKLWNGLLTLQGEQGRNTHCNMPENQLFQDRPERPLYPKGREDLHRSPPDNDRCFASDQVAHMGDQLCPARSGQNF